MSNLSLLATYDDIIRCQAVLMENDAEVAFTDFLNSFQDYHQNFHNIQMDNMRLQRELDKAHNNMNVLEVQLNRARRVLEIEAR